MKSSIRNVWAQLALAAGNLPLIISLSACEDFGSVVGSPTDAAPGATSDSGAPTGSEVDAAPADAAVMSDPYRAAVLSDGPVAYFRFEDSSGTALKNEIAGSPVTSLVVAGGAAFGADGISVGRHALRFSTPSDQVQVYSGTSYQGAQPFSIEAWVMLDQPVTTETGLFTNMDSAGADARVGQWMFAVDTGHLRSETWGGGGLLYYTESASPLPSAQWCHVVFTFSSATGVIVYVNGAPGAHGSVSAGPRVAPVAPLTWSGFVGRLDELAFYDRELSPARVAAHIMAR